MIMIICEILCIEKVLCLNAGSAGNWLSFLDLFSQVALTTRVSLTSDWTEPLAQIELLSKPPNAYL